MEGKTLTLGVSGKLWKNALVMYDRETRTLWSHLTGEGLLGPLVGKKLTMLTSVPKLKWEDWKRLYPETKVLTVRGREDQRRDSYRDYHTSHRTGLFAPKNTDDRLSDKDWVIGVTIGTQQKAYRLKKKLWKGTEKGKWRLIQDVIGEIPIMIYHDPENYATAVYERRAEDGKVLEFESESDGRRVSDRSGAKWDLLTGRGTEGRTLKPIPHMNVYWFAWADFYPETLIYQHEGDG